MWKIGLIKEREGAYELTGSDFERIADEAAERRTVFVQLYGGEPLIRDDILEIINVFRRRSLVIGLTTNGAVLTPELLDQLVDAGLDRLIISVDHHQPELHNAFRRQTGLLENIFACIRYAVASGVTSRLSLEINTVAHRRNFKELATLSTTLNDLGIRTHNINPIMSYYPLRMRNQPSETFDDLVFRPEDVPELRSELDRFYDNLKKLKMTTTNTREVLLASADFFEGRHDRYICAVGSLSCDIQADGDVLLCWGSETAIGNIRKNTLSDLWHSRRARDVKQELLSCTRCVDSCQADLRLRFSLPYVACHLPTLIREALTMTQHS